MKMNQRVFASKKSSLNYKKLNQFQRFSIFNFIVVFVFLVDSCVLQPNERTEKISFIETKYDHRPRGKMKAYSIIYTENNQMIMFDHFPSGLLDLPKGASFSLQQTKIFHKIISVSYHHQIASTSTITNKYVIGILVVCMVIQLFSIFFHHRILDTISAMSLFPIYYFIVFEQISKWIFLHI